MQTVLIFKIYFYIYPYASITLVEEEKAREDFKMNIYVSSGIRTRSLSHRSCLDHSTTLTDDKLCLMGWCYINNFNTW